MANLIEVAVPDIGDFRDVPVVEIMVAVGDRVEREDPLVALESDKATMEVPAPEAGVVRELRVAVGATVSEGSALLTLATDDDVPEAVLAGEDGSQEAEAAVLEQAEEQASEGRVYAGPAVRRRARELGIDLSAVSGSGAKGRITVEDLDSFERSLRSVAPLASAASQLAVLDGPGPAPWPQVDFARYGEIERVPFTKIQRSSAANMARNWTRIPHVTHNDEADITALEEFRKQVNGEQEEVKVTMVSLLMKASVAALQSFPRLNASLDGEELVLKRYYNIGFAADTPAGLVVPVIRDVERKGLLEVATELGELSWKARAARLSPAEMSGASFTISSLGGIGGTSFTPIINAPEVAVLGVVRARTQPVWDGQQFVPRLILPISLSYDHRVIDGAEAARFCARLAALLADMRRVLL